MLLQMVTRSLLGSAGHLSAQVLASSTCQTLLLQPSLGSSRASSSCESSLRRSCSYISPAAWTLAGSSSDGPASAATAQDDAPNTPPHPSAAGTAGGAVHAWVTSGCSSTRRLAMLPFAAASSKAWPAATVQARGVHSSRGPPPAAAAGSSKAEKAAAATRPSMRPSNSSSGGRGKGKLGVAAAGMQPGTPHQQRWRPTSSSKGIWMSARQLTVRLKDCTTPQQLLQLVQQHSLEQQGGVLDAIHVSTSYHRLGQMCQADAAAAGTTAAQQLLQHLDQLLPSVQQQLDAWGLANIIWSCAHIQHVAPVAQLLAAFLQQGTLSDANSQSVANVLWALAALDQQVPQQQLQQLVDALVRQADRAEPQAISNSMWALGKLGYQGPQQQLGELVAAFTAAGMLTRATPQAICNLLSGMAYMHQHLSDAQLQRLASALVSKCSRANAQDLTNFLWIVSELGQQVQAEQLEQLLATFEQKLNRAVPQDICHTLLAVARFRHVPVQLLAALEQQQHMQRFLAAANPLELANSAWACGMLGHNSKLLLGGLLQQAVKLLKQNSSSLVCQDLCQLCWAVAVLDLRQYVPEVLRLAGAASRVWGSAAPEDLRQLYQVHLWLLDHNLAPAEGGKGSGLLHVLSQQQLDECHRARQDQVESNAAAAPSGLQQQVFQALQQLPGWQFAPQQEVLTADRNFSIDIAAVTVAGVRLAVEVDGPSHFISPGNRVNGPTQCRIRALAARGYTVVSIPYWQWEGLRGAEQQQAYLQGRLQGLTPSAEPGAAAAAAAPAGQPPSTATTGSRRRIRSTKRRRDSSH